MEDGACLKRDLDHINQWYDLCMASGSKSIQMRATFYYQKCYNQLQKCWDTPTKNDFSCFKSLLVTGLWDIILNSLLPPIQSCSSKFWVWPCIASNFDKVWRREHKHKIMDRLFMPKYGSVSSTFATGCSSFHEITRAHDFMLELLTLSAPLILYETQRKNTPNKSPVSQANLQPFTLSQAFYWNAWFIIKEITFRRSAVYNGCSKQAFRKENDLNFNSDHLRHDYLFKYAYFSKCYLKRLASISAPEKWTTNVSQRKKHVKRDFK